MHDDTARRAGADHIGLLALPSRRGLGAGAVVGILERGEAPAADDLVGADGRGHFGRDAGLGVGAGLDDSDGRLMLLHAASKTVSAEAIARLATGRALRELIIAFPRAIPCKFPAAPVSSQPQKPAGAMTSVELRRCTDLVSEALSYIGLTKALTPLFA